MHNTADLLADRNAFTYTHNALGGKSLIDYVLVSRNLFNLVNSVNILDSGVNLSDHLPLAVKFDVVIDLLHERDASDSHSDAHLATKPLRWDKAELSRYYDCTYFYLFDVFQDLCHYNKLDVLQCPEHIIQNTYSRIITALHCSDAVIPRLNRRILSTGGIIH